MLAFYGYIFSTNPITPHLKQRSWCGIVFWSSLSKSLEMAFTMHCCGSIVSCWITLSTLGWMQDRASTLVFLGPWRKIQSRWMRWRIEPSVLGVDSGVWQCEGIKGFYGWWVRWTVVTNLPASVTIFLVPAWWLGAHSFPHHSCAQQW